MQTAVIYYIISNLRMLDNEKWKIVTPKYKLYPKNKEIPTKRIIDMFNKK